MDRERVDVTREFRGQRCINCAVSLDASLASECFRYDIYTVVCFSAGPMPGMSSMQMRFVFHAEAFRSESFR